VELSDNSAGLLIVPESIAKELPTSDATSAIVTKDGRRKIIMTKRRSDTDEG